jgi:hypothetical protein
MTQERRTERAAQRDSLPATDHDHVDLTAAELMLVVGGNVTQNPPIYPN